MMPKLGHIDDPSCDCGKCEPAEGPEDTLGAFLSGNPACDYPTCSINGTGCMWGDRRCFTGDIPDYE